MNNIISVNLFSQGFHEKNLDNYYIYYVLKGTIELINQDQSTKLNSSDIFAVNPHETIEIRATEAIFVEIEIDRYELLKLLDYKRVMIICDSTANDNQVYSRLRVRIEEMIRGDYENKYSQLFSQASVSQFLVYLITNFSNNIFIEEDNEARKDEIIAYIATNYNEDLSLQRIAENFGVTPQYFSKYFKDHFQLNFLKYLTNYRLKRTLSDLINSSHTLLKIALDHGFPNQNSFSKSFKMVYGMTPAEYRQQHKGEAQSTVEKNLDFSDIEYLLTHKESHTDPNVHTAEIVIPAKQEIFQPFWENLINLGELSKLFDNGLNNQVKQFKEDINFEKARVILDTQNLAHSGFFMEEKAIDFLVDLGFELLLVLDYREINQQENFGSYFANFLSHYSNRYGIDRLNATEFELIYNTQFSEKKAQAYSKLFKQIQGIFDRFQIESKLYGPGLLPGNSGENLSKFLESNRSIRYLSIGVAPYSIGSYKGEVFINRSADSEYISEQYAVSKNICRAYQIEHLLISNWQDSLNSKSQINDTSYKSASILKHLIDVYGEIDSLPIERPFDLMSTGISNRPLAGLPGIVSKDGIKKPAYYSYTFLNKLDKYFLYKDSALLVTNSNNKYFQMVCHNYKQPNFRFYNQEIMGNKSIDYETLFEDYEVKLVKIKLTGLSNGNYFLKSREVSEKKGSCFSMFNEMGFDDFSFFGKDELDYLKSVSKPLITGRQMEVSDNQIEIEVFLEPNEIRHLHLIYMH
ncbi:hypothetical protein BAU15_01185 [Enterococcus sp. JM4C]|uniref:helix-turn-helix domain-containing protein n=1 Tax=Candidatus Enterococcus huntleyi TaxID=1857217 RepID=UPI00137A393C|nr:helix-turn-helix domain-containing protein [Enterococcus sp. JM4C]KAF1299288.1 hypothetical protein BAU15_01185 [Enterococcus sp. JM4C]